MRTPDQYIDHVIGLLPSATPMRTQIATELRGHIAERVSHGHSVEEVLLLLGDPVRLAESYLSSVPLVAASFGTRAAAKLIDVATVLVAVTPLAWILGNVVPWELVPAVIIWVVIGGGSLLFAPYTVFTERAYGRTLGKRLLGVRVVTESGLRIGLGQSVVRQLPMFLQIYAIDVLFALFTEKSQRAFEMLSKTRVVESE
jgi:uncharacterized RDD family membrane protein YckC